MLPFLLLLLLLCFALLSFAQLHNDALTRTQTDGVRRERESESGQRAAGEVDEVTCSRCVSVANKCQAGTEPPVSTSFPIVSSAGSGAGRESKSERERETR